MILMAQPSSQQACIQDPIMPSPRRQLLSAAAPPHSPFSIPAPAPAPAHHPSDPQPPISLAHIVPASLASRSSQHTTRSRSSNDSSRSRLSAGKRASATGSNPRRGSSKSKSKARTNNILLNGASAVNNSILSAPALALNGSGNSPSSNTNAGAIADPKRSSSSTTSQMKRTASSGRVPRLPYTANGGLLSGTVQRSKVGGRVAATSASYLGGTGKSLYDSHARAKAQDQAMPMTKKKAKEAERDVSVLPTPASVASVHRPSPMQQQDKPAPSAQAPTTTVIGNGHVPSTRRSSSSARSRKSNGSGKAAKLIAQGLLGAGISASKRHFDTEYSDDSSDTDWTDDGSDDASGGGTNELGRDPEEEGAQDQGAEAQAEHDRMLAFAAAEEERERSLFAKLDKRSYTDLNRSRTQPSLLSMIFHPDPQLFPPDHPYRHTRSTQDILAHAVAPRASPSATTSATTISRTAFQPQKLQAMTKSTMAGPVQATVVASSVSTSNMHQEDGQPRQRSPLRLKGKPDNVDVEESESEGEGEANDLHMSKSVAHQRLAMLHNQQNGRRAAAAQANGNGKAQHLPPKMRTQENVTVAAARPATLVRVATEPITMQYPYNLPAPQLPSTPRTTRRTMLTHELSESLRRNLLWERQVSRLRPVGNGVYRRNSAGPTATLNGTVNGSASGSASGANGSNANAKEAEEEERRRRLERNKSWTDTYHTSGW